MMHKTLQNICYKVYYIQNDITNIIDNATKKVKKGRSRC
jgi:hypothetical protein